MTTWKQERPEWCPHTECIFKRRAMDSLCGGELPKPEPHGADFNTHRFCIREPESTPPIWDLQVNGTDLDWLRWVLDALDGKKTSWLSQRGESDQELDEKQAVDTD
jgi:hypothetical protein